MGKDKVNVGNMLGSDLYDSIWKRLDNMCPSTTKDNSCVPVPDAFTSTCMAGEPGKAENCKIKLTYAAMHWEIEQIRKLLIGTAAGALEAATLDSKTNDNCYDIPGHGRGCNVGNTIRVSRTTRATAGKRRITFDFDEKHQGLNLWQLQLLFQFEKYRQEDG